MVINRTNRPTAWTSQIDSILSRWKGCFFQ